MTRDYTDSEHELFASIVRREAEAIAEMLIGKNKQYGNAALNPIRIFTRRHGLSREALMDVRLDDKLSRIQLGPADLETEDVQADLLGYLILKRVGRVLDRMEERGELPGSPGRADEGLRFDGTDITLYRHSADRLVYALAPADINTVRHHLPHLGRLLDQSRAVEIVMDEAAMEKARHTRGVAEAGP